MMPSEVILNNRLDKDVQRIVFPINLMLAVFFTSKYTIRDNYITPKGYTFNILLLTATFVAYGLFLYNILSIEPEKYHNFYDNLFFFYLFMFFYGLYIFGFTMLMILNIVHSDYNISLILAIQYINNSIDFSKNVKGVIIGNWVSVIGICGLNMSLYLLYYIAFDHFNIIETFADWMFITFDVNLICAIRFIILLEKYLVIWKQSVLDDEREMNYLKLFEVYQYILEAYNLYKRVFQVLILFHTIDTFFRSLAYLSLLLNLVEMPTEKFDENEDSSLKVVAGIVLVPLWIAKDIFLVLTQSILCEKFYIAVEEAESACIQLVKKLNHSENHYRLCCNVIAANRTTFSKMTTCGLFYIDATLSTNFMGLLTTYVVIILQIYFL